MNAQKIKKNSKSFLIYLNNHQSYAYEVKSVSKSKRRVTVPTSNQQTNMPHHQVRTWNHQTKIPYRQVSASSCQTKTPYRHAKPGRQTKNQNVVP